MRLRRPGESTLPMMLALALSGCGNDATPQAGDGSLQDGDATAGRVPSWVLAAEPRFSLAESASDPEFSFVIPSFGVILEDGSTIIGDRGTESLIYLDPVGSATRVAGSRGEGPGEFRRLNAILGDPGESGVWAWDSGARRLSYFDHSGDYVTSLVAPTVPPPVAILPGPRFVTIAEPEEARGADSGRRRYALRDSQWTVVREIEGPPEPAADRVTYEASGIRNNVGLPAGCVPRVEEVVIGNELFAADAASGVIHAFGEDGSVREVYRATRRQRVTREIQAAMERLFTLPGREAPASVIQDIRNRVGDRLPAWQRVLADPEGRIWLQRSACPTSGDDDVFFEVVGVAGQLLGSITIPDGMRVLAVRGDNVLVMRLGELGVQHVEMYRLTAAALGAERTSAGPVRVEEGASVRRAALDNRLAAVGGLP